MTFEQRDTVSIQFESATVFPLADSRTMERATRVGWFVQKVDVKAASTRYRALHFARALHPNFHSEFLTSLSDVQPAIQNLDALIIVKRLDRTVLDVVSVARLFDVPVFLDLCDDLIAPGYSKNDLGTNLLHFLGVAPFLAGVTASSAEMADRIEAYARDNGNRDLRVHVIPDIAETRELYEAAAAMQPKDAAEANFPVASVPAEQLKRILWFGNFGASHSNFGMFTLRPLLKALRNVHAKIPLELVIVSNNEPVFNALVDGCGFPTRYVPWSPAGMYEELARADVSLLTTGDDEFCSIKSSNRVLQSLAAGVPVIGTKGPSVSEFDDVLLSGPFEETLRNCLGPARERLVGPKMERARVLLERYTPERLAQLWAGLLRKAIKGRRALLKPRKDRVLIVAEPGDDVARIKSIMALAKGLPGLDYQLLASTELIEEDPRVSSALAMSRKTPRFFSGRLKEGRNLLIGNTAVIVDRPEAPIAKLVTGFAGQLGIRVVTMQQALSGTLASLAMRSRPPAVAAPTNPGPYAEWSEKDGSVDWAFVVHQNARGWILDAISREVGSRQPASWKVFYYPETLSRARNYFFSHYLLLQSQLERNPALLEGANLFVYYTHPGAETPSVVARQLLAFEKVSKVVFMCESSRRTWIQRGLSPENTAVVPGGADPLHFRYHERGNGVVGLSSSFYERKNPDCLLEVIKLLPHRKFVLLGRKWNQYALFEEMLAQPNFEYVRAPYSDYPKTYDRFDVFLSMSRLEGGPIPLIEAMMSNAVPVASRTGFAPDIITDGGNGFLFDIDASANEIAELIEAAFALPGDIRRTVEHLDWDHFSASIVKLAQ